MKKLLILLVLIIGVSLQNSFAQRFKLNRAENKLGLFDFDKAVETYKKVLEKKPGNFEALYGLANAYRIRGDYGTAAEWYAKVVSDTANASAKDYLYYGECLRYISDYKKALENFAKFEKLSPDDPRGKLLNVSYPEVIKLIEDSLDFKTMSLSFNDDAQEFSPAFYKDSSIVFPSSRNDESKIDEYWYNKPYFDLYVSEMTDSGYSKPQRIEADINNRYHEGPLTFDTSYTTMYFTRNSYVNRKQETDDQGIMRLKIFSANASGDGDSVSWVNLKELPFNNDDYSCGHPTLTQDGKTLYFSSDMPGGYGSLDLYRVEMDSSGNFGEPKNLGKDINTPGEESFPYIHPDGTLYFSSDSRNGLGGLDVFYSKNEDTSWTVPVNMNYPINTNFDDFGLIMNLEKNGGYFSSNRDGDFNDDDIFSFEERGVLLKGIVVELKTQEPLQNALVTVENSKRELVDTFRTDTSGTFSFTVDYDMDYILSADKYAWFLISEKKVNTNRAVLETSKSALDSLRVIKLEMDKLEKGAVIKLENIYYDFDKYNIRPDAAEELDRIVKYLIKHPEMELELRSHTDSRGSDSYNLTLSDNRAKSAVEYLLENGAELNQLVAKGYGETVLVNECANGVECSKEKHQENRRTEFKVLKAPDEENIKVKSSTE